MANEFVSWDSAVAEPVVPAKSAKPINGTTIPWTSASGVDSFDQPATSYQKMLDAFSSFGEPVAPLEKKTSPPPGPRDQSFVENRGGAATGIIRQKRPRPGEPDPTLAERGGQVLGMAAQASDMATSTAKQILGIFPYVSAYWTARAGGATDVEAGQAGREMKDIAFPPEISTPWAKVAQRLGPAAQKAYEDNPVGWVMGKVGEVADKGTNDLGDKTGASPEHFKTLLDFTFGWLMKRGAEKGVKENFDKRMEQIRERGKPAEAAPEIVQLEPDTTSTTYEIKPKQTPVERKVELDAQIKEAGDAKAALGKSVKEAAKFTKMAEKLPDDDPLRAVLEERAVLATKEASRIQAEQEAARAAAAEVKTPLTPGDLYREAMKMRELSQTPGYLRTPEQMIQLRGMLKRMKEAGFNDAKVAAGILAGTVTGAALYKLYQTWSYKNEIEDHQRGVDDEYKSREQLRQNQFEYNKAIENLGKPPPSRDYDKEPKPRRNLDSPEEHPIFTAMQEATKAENFIPENKIHPGWMAALLAAGWVKAKGGMWHPEAVERLSRPLKEKVAGLGGNSANEALAGKDAASQWADKSIRNYLNKHAGTEGDPLKDVEIPHAGAPNDVMKWGDITDRYITGVDKEGPKGKETVWDFPGNTSSIQSYLSHVGDYLRQNVDPAKLQQYDLVRAVKETAQNDARVAKEMEKAAAASMKDMPVYKDYGDGMKWVELKLPEKLSEEQAKRTKLQSFNDWKLSDYDQRLLPKEDWNKTAKEVYDRYSKEGKIPYAALDTQGEPLKNSYTGDKVHAATPEEAHLAGQLAQEGNQMGHCVGGYCADVASGNTRILSLRDTKGRSHVTVEVSSEPSVNVRRGVGTKQTLNELVGPEEAYRISEEFRTTPEFGGTLHAFVVKNYPEIASKFEQNILQIKGKQNRAPDAKYLPYVQDLVKGGKWGEVGDLGNTGLTDTHGKYIRERTGETAERYMTDAEISEHMNKKQQGSADPRLLASIAAAGGIAAYAAAHPDQLQSLAALGLLAMPIKGLKSVRENLGQAAKGLDYIAGNVSTRLGNISPALKLRARNYEKNVLGETEAALNTATPFLQVLQTVKPGDALDIALLNDPGRVRSLLTDQPAAQKAWSAVEGMLKKFEQVHKDLGRFKEGLSNYFPRIVTDLEGLKKALGTEARTTLEEALVVANAQMMKTRQRGLTDVETSIIVNNSLRATPRSGLPGFARQRGVDTVTPELREFYADPADSLLRYISAAIQDAEMARFFGRDLKHLKVGGKLATDVDASIGEVVARELRDGNVTPEQMDTLRSLLDSRFKKGEKQMAGSLQDVRNASNVALLGQFGSAATQIGDSIMTVYHHGLMPTLQALKQKLTGNSQVTGREFGLVNHIAEELGSNRMSGKALQLVFKANGFSAIDQFAKGLNLNAGLLKNQALARTEKGRATLASRYAEAFGGDFPQLVADLQSKTISPNVKSLIFSELSDAQPISKMEMPQAYLDHPNGRLAYQMKTYMLKQMDIIRRDAYQEIAAGNYVRGAKNLVAVASALALSNIPGDVVKDWLSGRDAKLDSSTFTDALLKNFGISQYSLSQLGTKPVETVLNLAVPPYKHYQELLNAATSDRLQDKAKAMKYVPGVGRPIYDRKLGGNEARAAAEMKRLRAKLRDEREDANPALRTQRLQRQEIKRQKALQKLRNQR